MSTIVPALRFDQIPQGRPAFDREHGLLVVAGTTGQQRLQRALDALGPPGEMRWDPYLGEVKMRGQVFSAEALGSFNGQSWLFSWANEPMRLPAERTVLGRRLRDDAGRLHIPALAVPHIETDDELIPYMFGNIAVAQGYGHAYYVVNRSVVYLLTSKLNAPPMRPLDELKDAVGAARRLGWHVYVESIGFAAGVAGLVVQEVEDGLLIRDVLSNPSQPEEWWVEDGVAEPELGHGELHHLATCFPPVAPLRQIVAELDNPGGEFRWHGDDMVELVGPGYAILLSRVVDPVRIRQVEIELHRDGRNEVMLLEVMGRLGAGYRGTPYVAMDPTQLNVAPARIVSSFVGRTWMPVSAQRLIGGSPTPPVSFEAIELVAQLAARHPVFDHFLGRALEPAPAVERVALLCCSSSHSLYDLHAHWTKSGTFPGLALELRNSATELLIRGAGVTILLRRFLGTTEIAQETQSVPVRGLEAMTQGSVIRMELSTAPGYTGPLYRRRPIKPGFFGKADRFLGAVSWELAPPGDASAPRLPEAFFLVCEALRACEGLLYDMVANELYRGR